VEAFVLGARPGVGATPESRVGGHTPPVVASVDATGSVDAASVVADLGSTSSADDRARTAIPEAFRQAPAAARREPVAFSILLRPSRAAEGQDLLLRHERPVHRRVTRVAELRGAFLLRAPRSTALSVMRLVAELHKVGVDVAGARSVAYSIR
jgi:hypothetical protein